jgi:hypothetical protein
MMKCRVCQTKKASSRSSNGHTVTCQVCRAASMGEQTNSPQTQVIDETVSTRKPAKLGSSQENGCTASRRKRAALRSSEENSCTPLTRKRTASHSKAKHSPTASLRKQALHKERKTNSKLSDACRRTQGKEVSDTKQVYCDEVGVPYFGYKITHLKEAEWIKRTYGDAFELPGQIPKYKVRRPIVERRRLYPKLPVLKALLKSKEEQRDIAFGTLLVGPNQCYGHGTDSHGVIQMSDTSSLRELHYLDTHVARHRDTRVTTWLLHVPRGSGTAALSFVLLCESYTIGHAKCVVRRSTQVPMLLPVHRGSEAALKSRARARRGVASWNVQEPTCINCIYASCTQRKEPVTMRAREGQIAIIVEGYEGKTRRLE